MKLLSGLLAVLIVLLAGAGVFIWSGVYDIGADAPHWGITEDVLGTLRKRSVHVRGDRVIAPSIDDPKMIAEGAEHYSAMCVGCHLAPGVEKSELRAGLYPRPPALADVHGLTPGIAFWIIKHGIKMSAMPAWGATHSDEEIWNMVAFVQKLPGMTPEEYRALTADSAEGGHEHHHGGDDAGGGHGGEGGDHASARNGDGTRGP
jgi:mono/diheme cytochrome c family protein